MTFDLSINLGHVLTMAGMLVAIIFAWTKFGGRLDMIEYRVGAIEDAVKLVGQTLKTLAETEKKLAVVDARQLAIEGTQAAQAQTIEGLRRGEGYIQARRSNLDGSYSRE